MNFIARIASSFAITALAKRGCLLAILFLTSRQLTAAPNGVWQIAAAQVFRYYEDPALGKADAEKLVSFTGTYELAPGQIRTVTAEDGKLYVERKGKKEELFPEACDIFFRKGIEGRILFRADDKGKIDALIDRRNNEDVIWRKVK